MDDNDHIKIKHFKTRVRIFGPLFLLQNVTVVQEAQDLFASIDDHEGIDKAEPCRGMGGVHDW